MRAVARSVLVGVAVGLAFASTVVAPASPSVRSPTGSPDSKAPPGAPHNWLPDETWVAEHWLPYDERRLYRLLGLRRADVWRQLRDDRRTIAELARARGWRTRELARALVAPWRARLRDPRRLRLLEERALRTLTQGHLAQHLFFHSFHQPTIRDHAAAIFGVRGREDFLALRRSELSPLAICRLHGRSRAQAEQSAASLLRATAARGVENQETPAAQAHVLLARQLHMLPLWLEQSRYFGRPSVPGPPGVPAAASRYASDPVLSADGRVVAYAAYDARIPFPKRSGHLAVVVRGPGADPPLPAIGRAGAPRSRYGPTISADGRWLAVEWAEGGQTRIEAVDLLRRRTYPVSHRPGLRAARSAYDPTLSGDGRTVAYESYRRRNDPRVTSEVIVRDIRSGREAVVPPPSQISNDVYDPELSADGRYLAFTTLSPDANHARSAVFVRDLGAARNRRVSGAQEEAWQPAISARATVVAYTAAGPGARSHIVVRELSADRRSVIDPPAGTGLASEPSLSADGTRVAFVARPAGIRRTQVFVHDLRSRATLLVSRASGPAGAPAVGTAARPSISADGRRVAFTSDAWNLAPGKCNSARGVFVRDLERDTTRLLSDAASRDVNPLLGPLADDGTFVSFACAR